MEKGICLEIWGLKADDRMRVELFLRRRAPLRPMCRSRSKRIIGVMARVWSKLRGRMSLYFMGLLEIFLEICKSDYFAYECWFRYFYKIFKMVCDKIHLRVLYSSSQYKEGKVTWVKSKEFNRVAIG